MLKPLIQIALELLHLKLKTKSIIIQSAMDSMCQIVMYYNLYKLKVGKQKYINRRNINHVED